MAGGIVVRVRVRDEGEVESARRRSVRRRASKNAARPFWKSEASGFGEKYLHDGARRFGPRRARRGGATRSATRRWRPTLLTRIVAGRTKGGGRTFRGGGERSSAFPARRAGCDWRQPASARSGAHRATPRLRAFQRPRRRGRPRRGRGRAFERVSKRHRHEIAPANRAGRAMITLPGCGAVLEEKKTFHVRFRRSRALQRANAFESAKGGAENREDSSYGHSHSLSSNDRVYGPPAHFARVVCYAARRRSAARTP